MSEVGFFQSGVNGVEPITPTTLTDWISGTHTALGPIDYQDMLNASRAYVGAFREFDGKACYAPWSPDLTPEEEAEVLAAQERMMDRAMGA